nr:type VII secretion protein EccB [Salinibacterium sp. PAMC 21357]
MASKKDLIEAQGFSRGRLLSAFTGGAPGGKELEPAKPLRAVFAGIALTAMVLLAGVFYGFIRPGLPDGWEDNTLILVSDTGARYVSMEGVLYPVINTASARLIIPAGEFSVVSTDSDTLAGIEIGPTIGILGAPDDLPMPESLINSSWTSCALSDAESAVAVMDDTPIDATDRGAVVTVNDQIYVIAGDRRFEVDSAEAESVLRAVGLTASAAVEVSGRWLNLFPQGDALAPLEVINAGDDFSGTDFVIGTVLHPQGSDPDTRFVLTNDGQLAPLSPLAYQLYLLGSGALLGGEREVSPAEIAAIPTATDPAGGNEWPTDVLSGFAAETPPCALLVHDDEGNASTLLATATTTTTEFRPGTHVSIGGGALVRVGGTGTESGVCISSMAPEWPTQSPAQMMTLWPSSATRPLTSPHFPNRGCSSSPLAPR